MDFRIKTWIFLAVLVNVLGNALPADIAEKGSTENTNGTQQGAKIMANAVAIFLRIFGEDQIAPKIQRTALQMQRPANLTSKLPPPSNLSPTWRPSNEWVDDMLEKHHDDIKRLVGKIVLPSQFLRVGPATIELFNGYLANLHNVFRIGDWEVVRLDDRGERLRVNLLLGVDNVEAGYYCLAKLGLVGIKKTIKVFVPKVRLNVALTQDFRPTSTDSGFEGENVINLRAGAQIRLHLVGLHIDVKSLGFPFDQIFSLIANAVANVFRNQIKELVKVPIRDFIRKISGQFW